MTASVEPRARTPIAALLARGWQAIAVLLAVWVVLVGSAGPALAHFGDGQEPSNYSGEITAVEPPMPGVSVTLLDNADRIELRNPSATPVIVYGYQHQEPGDRDQYLKISSDGVWVNTESQAYYLNQTLYGSTSAIPERLLTDTGEGEPVWEKVSDDDFYRWHDHRTHWMSDDPPPAVQAAPGERHVIGEPWEIYATYGDQPESTITGTLEWVPGAPVAWWVLLAVGVAAGGLALLPGWRRLLAGAALLLGVLAIGQAAVSALPEDDYQGIFSFVLASAWVPALAVAGLAVLAARRLLAEGASGRFLLGGAGAIAALQGVSDLDAIWSSQLPQSGPGWLTRAMIALVVGLGLGLLIAAVVIGRREREDPAYADAGDETPPPIASDEEMAEIVAQMPTVGKIQRKKRPKFSRGGLPERLPVADPAEDPDHSLVDPAHPDPR